MNLHFRLNAGILDDTEIEVVVELKRTIKVDAKLTTQEQAAIFERLHRAGIKEGILTGIDWAIMGEEQ